MSLINLGVPLNLLDGVAAATITGDTFASPARASQYTYQTIFGSTPSAISLVIQTSLNGTDWVTVSTTTATAGATVTFQSAAPFIRAKINSITGGTTITVSIIAKTGVIGTESFVSGPLSVTSGSLTLFDGVSGDLLKELLFSGDINDVLRGDGTFGVVENPFDQDLNIADDVEFNEVTSTFKSSDGTAGKTAGPFTVITGIQVKDGLVTTLTGT